MPNSTFHGSAIANHSAAYPEAPESRGASKASLSRPAPLGDERRREAPLDDLTCDVLAVLQAKAKGLEAYDKYIDDAEDDPELAEVFHQLREQDEEQVRVLKEHLTRLLVEDADMDEEEQAESYAAADEADPYETS